MASPKGATSARHWGLHFGRKRLSKKYASFPRLFVLPLIPPPAPNPNPSNQKILPLSNKSPAHVLISPEKVGASLPDILQPFDSRSGPETKKTIMFYELGGGTPPSPQISAAQSNSERQRYLLWGRHWRGGRDVSSFPGAHVLPPGLDLIKDATPFSPILALCLLDVAAPPRKMPVP